MVTRPRVLGARPKVERSREYDARRREAKPWRAWYALPEWQAIRAIVLAERPLCERHKRAGSVVAATIVNHVHPHRGDWTLFLAGPFEALCKPCHDGDVQREERRAARSLVVRGADQKSGV